MEFNTKHPLDNITRNNPYSMLEALIPFVDYPMKLPLALLVKYQELRMIMNAFHSSDNLSKFGLHNDSNDPMDMMANVMGVSPEMLKTVMSMMANQTPGFFDGSMFNHQTSDDIKPDYNAESTNLCNNNHAYQNNGHEGNSSMDENIKKIFAEYDMLQAAEYSEDQIDKCSNEYINDDFGSQTDNYFNDHINTYSARYSDKHINTNSDGYSDKHIDTNSHGYSDKHINTNSDGYSDRYTNDYINNHTEPEYYI